MKYNITLKACQIPGRDSYIANFLSRDSYLAPNGVATTPRRGEEGLPCTKKPQIGMLPKWDLPRVLRALAKAQFELMHKCSILNLSVKNALRFLLAVASGARRSLIHALSI